MIEPAGCGHRDAADRSLAVSAAADAARPRRRARHGARRTGVRRSIPKRAYCSIRWPNRPPRRSSAARLHARWCRREAPPKPSGCATRCWRRSRTISGRRSRRSWDRRRASSTMATSSTPAAQADLLDADQAGGREPRRDGAQPARHHAHRCRRAGIALGLDRPARRRRSGRQRGAAARRASDDREQAAGGLAAGQGRRVAGRTGDRKRRRQRDRAHARGDQGRHRRR